MKLENALDQIGHLQEGEVIFARRPWSLSSDAVIGSLDDDYRVPKVISDLGFDYFLEVTVAQEVLEVLGDRQATVAERRSLLMYYAEHDAYPEWVYNF